MFGRHSHCRALIAAGLLACSAAPAAYGGDDVGHQEARRLVQEGRILPLTEILERVARKAPGEVLEVELELDDGVYVYELKILGPDGRVRDVEIDAPSGKILEIEDDD
jgi:uncharacterized membrane protein YkoI